jgi:hypothetical protein
VGTVAAREVLGRVLGKSQASNHVTMGGQTTFVSEQIVDASDEQMLDSVGPPESLIEELGGVVLFSEAATTETGPQAHTFFYGF